MNEVKFTLYDPVSEKSASHKRRVAVGAALELIACYGLGGSDTTHLETHIANLSDYADTIQAALENGGS